MTEYLLKKHEELEAVRKELAAAGFTLTIELETALENLAKETGRSMSYCIKKALQENKESEDDLPITERYWQLWQDAALKTQN